jgi:hypothetical protein
VISTAADVLNSVASASSQPVCALIGRQRAGGASRARPVAIYLPPWIDMADKGVVADSARAAGTLFERLIHADRASGAA